jgi:hypothetical protein
MRLRAAACSIALVLGVGCEDGPYVRIAPGQVLYDGEPYGDFVILGDAVRDCMQSDKNTLPRLILVEGLFECHTTFGWRHVFGCTSDHEIFVVASIVRDTGGQLWAHELTHYFGAEHEDEPCGTIALVDFSLALPDGGVPGGGPATADAAWGPR